MNLSEKIVKLRHTKRLSQEELADILKVSRQSVSKWESGQSLPEVDKIILLSEFFGVSTDYLLKDSDNFQSENATRDTGFFEEAVETDAPVAETVTKERLSTLITAKFREARIIAIAVAIFILSPITLICLATSTDSGFISTPLAVGLGLAALFPLVSLGIGLCIYSQFLIADKKLKGTNYALDDYAKRLLADEKLALKKRNLKFYIIGLTLTILSPLSLILYTVISESETLVYLPITLLVLFVMASIGVSLLTNAGMRDEALASFDFEAQNAEKSTKKRIIDIYWSALPFLYLLVSFLTGRWDITWIIWPLSPIIPELITLFSKKKQ